MHKLRGALLITEVFCAGKEMPRDAATDGEKLHRGISIPHHRSPGLEACCSALPQEPVGTGGTHIQAQDLVLHLEDHPSYYTRYSLETGV